MRRVYIAVIRIESIHAWPLSIEGHVYETGSPVEKSDVISSRQCDDKGCVNKLKLFRLRMRCDDSALVCLAVRSWTSSRVKAVLIAFRITEEDGCGGK